MRKVNKYNRLSPKTVTLKTFKYISVIFAALVTLLPMVVVFFGSFKTGKELMTTNPLALPKDFTNFSNYVKAFVDGNMLRGFANTAIILVVSLVATVLTGSMTAYVLSRFKFRGSKLLKNLFLIASLVPGITMQISTFQIVRAMGLYNTRASVILLYAGTDIISIYIFMQFMNGIPKEIDEAAIVDGASFPKIFFGIIMPLLKPAIATVVVIKGVGFYNDFITPNLYMKKSNLSVISTALYKFKGPYSTQWEVILAGCAITMIPTLIIFLLLQKWIYSGLTAGSVKG